jgi:putative heme degradation protein
MAGAYSTAFRQRIRLPRMGLQDPKDIARDTAHALSASIGELAALKRDATHWLLDPEYVTLRQRLEAVHAATEAALVETRRRVRLNERQGE